MSHKSHALAKLEIAKIQLEDAIVQLDAFDERTKVARAPVQDVVYQALVALGKAKAAYEQHEHDT